MTYMSNVDADRELDAVAKTRATWLRVLIDWHLVEPMPGAFDWGYVDHWINGARQRGLNVLGLIAYTPDWARAPGSYFSAPPVDPRPTPPSPRKWRSDTATASRIGSS
jgi:hypothetical protein